MEAQEKDGLMYCAPVVWEGMFKEADDRQAVSASRMADVPSTGGPLLFSLEY